MNKQKSLIITTSITSLLLAICAAVFSVTGIAKLFAGAALSAAIMASVLELGKLVSISFLYQYWENIPKSLKYYLSTSSVVLMLVTSAGIYGYLSSAYAKVAATPLTLTADIQSAQGKVNTVEQDIKRKEQRLNQLIVLRTQQETRVDQLITKSSTGNNSTIRNAQKVLDESDKNVSLLQKEISTLSSQRDSLNEISIKKRVEIETNGDIGTFVYIAKILETDLDTVVKWFTLIIVLVFDPLAVALVIAVNFLLKHNQQVREEPKNAFSEDEPYKIYTSTEQPSEIITPEQPITQSFPNDAQYFARGDFDWNNKLMWEGNPKAVHYYETQVKPRLQNP